MIEDGDDDGGDGDDDDDDDGFDQKKGEDTLAQGQSRSFSYCINKNHTF